MSEKKIASCRTETNPALLKSFFKTHYSEKYRAVNIITRVIAVILLVAAAAAYYNGLPIAAVVICAWLGLFLIVYPSNAYRRPYKAAKNNKAVTHFEFYKDYMTERGSGSTEKFKYSDIYKTIETSRYFYIYHSPDTASVVEKDNISFGTADAIGELLKSKTKYKKK